MMATHQQEISTPVVPHDTLQSPAAISGNADLDHYQYQSHPDSAFKLDVAAGTRDLMKEEAEKARPLKKFFWWRITKKQRIYAILGLVLLLLVVIILIVWFVVVKAIFQHYVDKVEMTVNYLDINQIEDQTILAGEMSLHMKHDINLNSKTDATTATLLYDGSAFATLEFPALTIEKGPQEYDLNITGDVTVIDSDVFIAMSAGVMDLASVVLDASATVKAHGMGISYGGLDFSRELTFDGLNNFRDPLTVIDHIDFWGCTDAGWTMDIDVNVTNVSQMGLDGIGYLNLTLYVDQDYLGYLSGQTPDVGVPRGVSTETFRLFVDITDHTTMVKMVTALIDGHVQYFITGESPYATEYTLFKDALSIMNMSIIYEDGLDRIDLNTSCDLLESSPVSPAPTSSSSSGFGLRQYFRRSPSQSPPPSSSGGQALRKSLRRPEEERQRVKADLESPPDPKSQAVQGLRLKPRQMQRSAVFGSCAQAVGTVASVLFSVINQSGHYDEMARDSTVTRQAKMLYVSLLESVQKERGEWQGFSSSSLGAASNNDSEDPEASSPQAVLTSSISANSPVDQLGILNELLEVSFRNLLGPLVPLDLYVSHKKALLRESLAVPPALTTLLAIRGILDRLEREVRHCLLRVLALWDLIALVNGEAQPLLKTIADKHHHVFSESSEFESMASPTARKSGRQDAVAISLLQIMVLYRDILFSDIEVRRMLKAAELEDCEFILIKQELQINPKLVVEIKARAWPSELEAALGPEEEEEEESSYSDDASISSSDENQLLHDDEDDEKLWEDEVILGPPVERRSRAPSSVASMREEDELLQEYYSGFQDGVVNEGDWAIPSPPRHGRHQNRQQERKALRSRSMASPPASGGVGPLHPVAITPSSSVGIPPPKRAQTMSPEHRPMLRVSSGRRQSQQSSPSAPDSPTWSAASQASSSTRPSSRTMKQRRKQRSAPSSNGRSDRQRFEAHWQDTASNESRSPPPASRSMTRKRNSRRRGSNSSAHRSTDHSHKDALRAKPGDRAKPAAPRGLRALAASCFTLPVAAATLCVVATVATVALWGLRNAPRN
ncbi:hypothetical protein BBJ28_00013636 [Nothophytophthora sp. Chile5]|nr:hypothetical protein BBJ28_00013636 [Nothophytophthora sp. Chile5]